ncbi:hypothetical protein EDB83DRAFT_2549460 [Lactarius deliciosus]|nr:hypothetical protein EDB83DRAFT_2555772 [Lactarius deliciosus]KAH9074747.1 hypothetical protein EDB83DRAFT_2549460 [Lactarius deliciosus]
MWVRGFRRALLQLVLQPRLQRVNNRHCIVNFVALAQETLKKLSFKHVLTRRCDITTPTQRCDSMAPPQCRDFTTPMRRRDTPTPTRRHDIDVGATTPRHRPLCSNFDDFVSIGAPLLLASSSPTVRWRPRRTGSTPCGTRLPGTPAGTCIVTYLARQDGLEGKRLRAADHAALLDVLAGLARTGVTVHVVDEKASWTERMRAVAQSSIVLSVFRDHVANAVLGSAERFDGVLPGDMCSRMQSDIS